MIKGVPSVYFWFKLYALAVTAAQKVSDRFSLAYERFFGAYFLSRLRGSVNEWGSC